MTKGDVCLIISQIYFVGAFLSEKDKDFLRVFGAIWLFLTFIAWGIK